MIESNLLKFSFIWNFYVEFNLTSFVNLKYNLVIKAIEIFSFLPLKSNSVTTGFSFFIINHISSHVIKEY